MFSGTCFLGLALCCHSLTFFYCIEWFYQDFGFTFLLLEIYVFVFLYLKNCLFFLISCYIWETLVRRCFTFGCWQAFSINLVHFYFVCRVDFDSLIKLYTWCWTGLNKEWLQMMWNIVISLQNMDIWDEKFELNNAFFILKRLQFFLEKAIKWAQVANTFFGWWMFFFIR